MVRDKDYYINSSNEELIDSLRWYSDSYYYDEVNAILEVIIERLNKEKEKE